MDSNRQGQNTNGSNTGSLDSNPSLVDSNLLGQIIIRSEVYQLDSNHLRKIEDRTENKEMDSNPSYMDSNHSVSFEVRSQRELHGFESLLKDSNHLRKIETELKIKKWI